MDVAQISQLMNLSGLKDSTSIGDNKSSSNSDFALQLENLMNNMNMGNSTQTTSANSDVSTLLNSVSGQGNSSIVSGVDSLSLQPDQIFRMLQMQSSNDALISDDSGDDGISSDLGGGTDMSAMLQAMMQNQNQSTTNNVSTNSVNGVGSLQQNNVSNNANSAR